ncbi:MAG: ATP-dependent DNA helicase RecG, partial [Schleiferiaceae bacterium]
VVRAAAGGGLTPLYSSTEKLGSMQLHSRGLAAKVDALLEDPARDRSDWMPDSLRAGQKWPARDAAVRTMHHPESPAALAAARNRLAFEELFLDQLLFAYRRLQQGRGRSGHRFASVGDYLKRFYDDVLPFPLTEAQKRVVRELRRDMGSGAAMNRLVQGDVGSGKTLVAFMAMLLAVDNGFQAALMAPTEILAQQHARSLAEWADPLGLRVGLLTGSVKGSARKTLLAELAEGQLNLLVGTHALIEDPVVFRNLGLAVVDEQHRFGVAQRAKLLAKNRPAPHMLVMTATPIPRTLAMSLYGDLEQSVIDELPPGRKPIQTLHRTDANRLALWGFLKKEIALGRQVYMVYPLIEESEKLDYKDLMDGYESVCRDFPQPEYQVSIVHGRMKPEAKEWEMQRFARGETQIMVATTVIEVGVNVPNASVMVIENAERFGLSQLHQLRGRVGRGAEQSYCVLMTSSKLNDDAVTRIETMVRTQDGFEIADVDLQLRGPGDLMGTRQSGVMEYKLANLVHDAALVEWARRAAVRIVDDDPQLERPEHAALRARFSDFARGRMAWGRIA